MEYNLANTQEDHVQVLSSLLGSIQHQEQDVFLVSKEGHRVYTHRILLAMYSSFWRDLVRDAPDQAVIGVNIPVRFVTLTNLVKILTSGEVESDDYDSLEEVKSAADYIGIEMVGWKLESTNPQEQEMEGIFNFDHSENNDNGSSTEIANIKEEVSDSEVSIGSNKMLKTLKKRKEGSRKPLQLKCDDCEKTFSERGNFNRHSLTHSGIKKFSCEDCEMMFSRKDKLKLHVTLIHSATGAETYGCDQCDKKFTRKDHLSRHKSHLHI